MLWHGWNPSVDLIIGIIDYYGLIQPWGKSWAHPSLFSSLPTFPSNLSPKQMKQTKCMPNLESNFNTYSQIQGLVFHIVSTVYVYILLSLWHCNLALSQGYKFDWTKKQKRSSFTFLAIYMAVRTGCSNKWLSQSIGRRKKTYVISLSCQVITTA